MHKHLGPGWHWECWPKKSGGFQGGGMQIFLLLLPLSASYVVLIGCYQSVKIFPNTLALLIRIHHQNWKYLSQASLLEDTSHQIAQVIKSKKGREHYSLLKLLGPSPCFFLKGVKKTPRQANVHLIFQQLSFHGLIAHWVTSAQCFFSLQTPITANI